LELKKADFIENVNLQEIPKTIQDQINATLDFFHISGPVSFQILTLLKKHLHPQQLAHA